MIKISLAALSVGALMLAASVGDAAAKTLKLQTSQSAGDFTFKYLTEKWAPKVEAMSGGSLKLQLMPTKSVVPHRETIDAVAVGILDGDLNAVSYFSGRDPVFAILGDLIAGYDNPTRCRCSA